MATQRRGQAVFLPNLGLYLGLPPLLVPERGLQACNNVRISQGRITRGNLGWTKFPNDSAPINLDSKPVLLIDSFTPRGGVTKTIFGNTTDLFEFNDGTDTVSYITPRVETGTVDATNGSAIVTGNATSWLSTLKQGDFIHIGATTQRDPSAKWYEIDSVDGNTQITLTKSYVEPTTTTADYTARSVLTGDLRSAFVTETFFAAENVSGTDGDRWYATNGVDKIHAWDGTSNQAYVPTMGNIDSAVSIRRFKNIMYYIAPTVSGEDKLFSIRTSEIQEPENVSTGSASEFIVHDGADPLLTAMPIGDLMAIYGERSITLAQFVGGTLVFVFRTAVAGFGPLSPRAVAQFPDGHLFLAADAQYRFDGAAARPINSHVWRDVNRRVSPQRLDFIHSVFDEENGDLLWVIPLTTDADPAEGQPETAFVSHYLEDVGPRDPTPHTQRDLPATATGFFERATTLTWDAISERFDEFNFRWNDSFFSAAFPQILFGDANGDVFFLNESSLKTITAEATPLATETEDELTTESGDTIIVESGTTEKAPLTSFARFSRRPLANKPSQKGVVRRVYPFLEQLSGADYSVNIQLRTSDRADGDSTQVASLPFSVNDDANKNFVSPRVSGRYVEVEFYTDDVSKYWAVTGYDMDVVSGGER